jgi:hypothetical protein
MPTSPSGRLPAGVHEGMAEEEKPDVTNKHVGDKAEVARVLAWRKQHPDRYRETQRNLMRKRRAKLKLDPSAV